MRVQSYTKVTISIVIVFLLLFPLVTFKGEAATVDKILGQNFYFHRNLSGMGNYRDVNLTRPTYSDSNNISRYVPIGVFEVGDGWITPAVPRDINLTRGYTFAFSIWAAGNGQATLFFRLYAYRNSNEYFLFTSDPSTQIPIAPMELLWYHQTKEVTLQIKKDDRLVLRLYIAVSVAGTFGLGYDCIQYPSYVNDPSTVTLRPSAAGVQTQLYPVGATYNWQCVDEVTANGLTDYVSNFYQNAWEDDLYDIPTSGIPDGSTINSVTVYWTANKWQMYVSPCSGRPDLRDVLHAKYILGTTVALTTTWTEYSQTWNTNPVTGYAWTLAEINLLQIGVGLTSWDLDGSGAQCTQEYVVVTYTSNTAPVNDACSALDLDSGNILAWRTYYSFSVNVTDADGVTDLNYVELRFEYPANTYTTTSCQVRWTETTNTFSIVGTADLYISISGSTKTTSGNQVRLVFKVAFDWDYPLSSDIDAQVYSLDDASASDMDTYNLNMGFINTVTTTPSSNDYNADVGSNVIISGTVVYTGTAIALPNTQINANGVVVHNSAHASQGTSSSASYSITITLPSSVANNSYHIYVDGSDADFSDGDKGSNVYVVSNRINFYTYTLSAVDDSVPVNTNGVWYCTLKLEFDDTPLTSGTVNLDTGTMSYNGTYWIYTYARGTEGNETRSITSVSGMSYGITALNSAVTSDSQTITFYIAKAWQTVAVWSFNLLSRQWLNISTFVFSLQTMKWNNIILWNLQLQTRLWNAITTWTFNLLSGKWNSISTFTFSLLTREWNIVSSWAFTLATLGWHPITYWNFDLSSRIWSLVTSWSFNLLSRTWQSIGSFTFSFLARLWQTIATISFSLIARIWQNIASWSFSLATMTWNTISQWTFNLATMGWKGIASWTFDLGARTWQNIASWLFSLTSRSWETITTWTFNLVALGWHPITVWTFTLLPQILRVFPFIWILTAIVLFGLTITLFMAKFKKEKT